LAEEEDAQTCILYSDCGTNFIGTNRYLQEVYSILKGPRCVENAVDNQIRWHFNPIDPPPHMGGLWEATVKSTKTLLLRIIQDMVMTYEELNTAPSIPALLVPCLPTRMISKLSRQDTF